MSLAMISQVYGSAADSDSDSECLILIEDDGGVEKSTTVVNNIPSSGGKRKRRRTGGGDGGEQCGGNKKKIGRNATNQEKRVTRQRSVTSSNKTNEGEAPKTEREETDVDSGFSESSTMEEGKVNGKACSSEVETRAVRDNPKEKYGACKIPGVEINGLVDREVVEAAISLVVASTSSAKPGSSGPAIVDKKSVEEEVTQRQSDQSRKCKQIPQTQEVIQKASPKSLRSSSRKDNTAGLHLQPLPNPPSQDTLAMKLKLDRKKRKSIARVGGGSRQNQIGRTEPPSKWLWVYRQKRRLCRGITTLPKQSKKRSLNMKKKLAALPAALSKSEKPGIGIDDLAESKTEASTSSDMVSNKLEVNTQSELLIDLTVYDEGDNSNRKPMGQPLIIPQVSPQKLCAGDNKTVPVSKNPTTSHRYQIRPTMRLKLDRNYDYNNTSQSIFSVGGHQNPDGSLNKSPSMNWLWVYRQKRRLCRGIISLPNPKRRSSHLGRNKVSAAAILPTKSDDDAKSSEAARFLEEKSGNQDEESIGKQIIHLYKCPYCLSVYATDDRFIQHLQTHPRRNGGGAVPKTLPKSPEEHSSIIAGDSTRATPSIQKQLLTPPLTRLEVVLTRCDHMLCSVGKPKQTEHMKGATATNPPLSPSKYNRNSLVMSNAIIENMGRLELEAKPSGVNCASLNKLLEETEMPVEGNSPPPPIPPGMNEMTTNVVKVEVLEIRYICPTCMEVFPGQDEMKEHIRLHIKKLQEQLDSL